VSKRFLRFTLWLLALSLISIPSINAKQYQSNSKVVALNLSFADAGWDGKIIPEGQQCKEFGGNGASPRIEVKNIPPGANKLILEFSDATYSPCDNGGHGIISYQISKGTTEVIIPSIPGQTFNLPDGFTLIREHCGKDLGMQPGAYIGPCPGIGNIYYVIIKAVYGSPENSKPKLLGSGRLNLGTYKQ
jgi:hypothetical protein